MVTCVPPDCSRSDVNPVPIGQAVAKNQPVFVEFLRGIQKKVDARVKQEDIDSIKFAREFPDQI